MVEPVLHTIVEATTKRGMVKVREASAADIPVMMDLERHAAMAGHWRKQDYLRIFNGAKSRLSMVLEEDGNALAFIVVANVGAEWELENIAVAAEARRRGLGTRLMTEFMDVARGRGAESVFLEVRESNRAARALYEKWAFVETGRRRGYYSEPAEDAVIYRFDF